MYPDLCLLSYTACSHSGRADTAASLCWHVPTDSQQCRDLLDSHEKCVQLLTQNAPQVWPQRIESWSLSQWQGKGFYHAHSDTQSHVYTHCCNKLRVCKLRCVFDHIQAKGDPTFKDNDFIQMDGMVSIGEEAKTDFMSKIEADVEVCPHCSTHTQAVLSSFSLSSFYKRWTSWTTVCWSVFTTAWHRSVSQRMRRRTGRMVAMRQMVTILIIIPHLHLHQQVLHTSLVPASNDV